HRSGTCAQYHALSCSDMHRVPDRRIRSQFAMTASELERDLAREIVGDLRFDRVSRALYSTDASVYQIEPLGIVIPRTADDAVATVKMARRHAVSITARGGGTSQAGQAVGAGLQLDTAKYLNRIVEGNAAVRWAWVA